MTNISKLAKRAQKYIQLSKTETLNFQELAKSLNQQIDEGLKGYEEAKNILTDRREKMENTLYHERKELEKEIENMRESEIQAISKSEQPVTADMVAELDLLNQTIVEGEDISKYISKYKDIPLAMRRLKDIASSNKIMGDFPADKSEQLNTFLGNIQSFVEYSSEPKIDGVPGTIEMIADGNIERIEQDLDTYNNL